MSDFISFLPAPGDTIANYDRSKPANQQHSSISPIFLEAMSIREEVFVREQGVPLENELDEDDPRSFHWVICASVGTNSQSPDSHGNSSGSPVDADGRRRSSGSISRKAVGTLRLVPPPHPPHPTPGSHHAIDNAEGVPKSHKVAGRHSEEPYVKLGRLAVLPTYRSHGLARLIVHTALQWAANNAGTILPMPSPAQIEKDRLAGKMIRPWEGLVLIHAQVGAAEKWWAKQGFKRDEGMGVWDEEGIDHVGMWKRVAIPRDRI